MTPLKTATDRSRADDRQKGAAAVEFALLAALVILPLGLGVLDFGIAVNARHVVSRAAREGLVMAIRGQDPEPAVLEALERAGLDPAMAGISATSSEADPGLGAEMRVAVSYDISSITVFPWPAKVRPLTLLHAQAVGRHL